MLFKTIQGLGLILTVHYKNEYLDYIRKHYLIEIII